MSVVGGAASGAATGLAIGGPWGAAIGGVVGGLTSMFSAASQADQINENIRAAKALMEKGLISQDELADRLHSIDRQFNSRLTSVMNSAAIRSRGIANMGTVKAAAAGAVEGARMATEMGVVEQSLSENRGIRQAQAQLELGKTDPDMIGSFAEGAAAGVATGMEVEKFISGPGEIPGLQGLDRDTPTNRSQTGGLTPIGEAGKFNPHLRAPNPFGETDANRVGNISVPQDLNYMNKHTGPMNALPQQSPFLGNVNMRGIWD